MQRNRALVIVVVLVLGIMIGFVAQASRHKDNGLSSSVNEISEEIKDEIDDHTTSRN